MISDNHPDPKPSHTEKITNQTFNQNHLITFNDPVELLTSFSKTSATGVLNIHYEDIHWKIYLDNGNVKFALLSLQSLEDLTYHLRFFGCKHALEAIKAAKALDSNEQQLIQMPVDQIIEWLHRKEFINDNQVSQLAERVSKQALEPLIWLNHGHYSWEDKCLEQPAVAISNGLKLSKLVAELQTRLNAWQPLIDEIDSPYQRPYFFNARASQNAQDSILVKLSKFMRGLTIQQLASIIQQDEIKFARILYPYLQNGDIVLRAPKSPWNQLPNLPRLATPSAQVASHSVDKVHTKTYKIACVDDSPTVLQEIQRLLNDEKYEVTKIDNPVEAASTLFRLKPDLVLMDISMPEINGYKLCSLLRNSNALAGVPIIMVTSRSGMIDKVRAKTVGASDYLTKPFTKGSLLTIVEKYLS